MILSQSEAFIDVREIDPTAKLCRPVTASIKSLVPEVINDAVYLILSNPKYKEGEGRGIYPAKVELEEESSRCIYVKGTGCRKALKDSIGHKEHHNLPGIGGASFNTFFLERPSFSQPAPRIRGAMSMVNAEYEYCLSAAMLAGYCASNQINDLAPARKAGLTIPLGIVDVPKIKDKVQDFLLKINAGETEGEYPDHLFVDTEHPNYSSGFGMVGFEVPSAKRVRPRDLMVGSRNSEHIFILEHDTGFIQGARVVREMFKLGVVYSDLAVQYQNIFDAPDSAFPCADFGGMVSLNSINRGKDDIARDLLVANQMKFAPFGLLESKNPEVKQIVKTHIADFVSELTEGRISYDGSLKLCERYEEKPLEARLALAFCMRELYSSAQSDVSDTFKELASQFADKSRVFDFEKNKILVEIERVRISIESHGLTRAGVEEAKNLAEQVLA